MMPTFLAVFGPPFIRRGTYADAVVQQDIVPTLAIPQIAPAPDGHWPIAGKSLGFIGWSPARHFGGSAGRYEQDYFERHREGLPTLTRLRRDGAWFSNARVNFLPTVTALAMPPSEPVPIRACTDRGQYCL